MPINVTSSTCSSSPFHEENAAEMADDAMNAAGDAMDNAAEAVEDAMNDAETAVEDAAEEVEEETTPQ